MLGRFRNTFSSFLNPAGKLLYRMGMRPNHVTLSALLLGLLASFLIIEVKFIPAAILLALSGFLDLLDGALARNSNEVTDFGGILDSVADRYVDAAILISLGIAGFNWLVVSVALLGSLMVSYTRARAENVIHRCDVGVAERGERLLIIIAGLTTGFVNTALILVAVLSHLTVLHRLFYAWNQLKK